MNLFAYGTLMWPEVLADVIGRSVEGEPAILHDARRLRVNDQVYPSLVSSEGFEVEGVIYFDLTESEIAALDRFEGSEYERRLVAIEATGGPFEAAVYFSSERGMALLEKDEWHPEQLSQTLVDHFRNTYKEWC
jgi:gamma-glutamylcyclotransferase (GGCT)/AIG2-like uncharacterized protein YtfP